MFSRCNTIAMHTHGSTSDRAGMWAVIIAVVVTILGAIGIEQYASLLAPTPVKVKGPMPSMKELHWETVPT